ncbi:hypothetical protein [Lactococcus raffinolactis]|uniref:hypothetical protein n=1 Tax=Pseudolactococcus raffinolactis TaxID=1366 RepID=UPI0039AEB655
MELTKGKYSVDDFVIKLSKGENLALRKALNSCKKEEVSEIQLNRGEWFMPFVVEK